MTLAPAVSEFFARVAEDPTIRALSMEQIRFITALASFGSPPTTSGAGAAAGMSSAGQTTRVVTALAKARLVERLPPFDGDDLRITRVQLTEQGRDTYTRLARLYRIR